MPRVFHKPRGSTVAGRKPWFIDWTDAAGKRHRERTDAQTKAEAQAVLRAKLSQNARCEILGTTDASLVRPVRFGDFFEEEYLPYAEVKLRPSTYGRIPYLAKHLMPHFRDLTLRAIGAAHVEKFIEKRADDDPKPSAAEINKERSLLSGVLNMAFRRGLIDVNPVTRVGKLREDNTQERWLTRAEVDAILDKAEAWVRPFIVLAVHTGLREGELCSLRWRDLDANPGFIRIGEDSKTHKPRSVPINSVAREILECQPRRIGRNGPLPWVFVNPRRQSRYRGASVYHSYKAAARAAAAELKAEGKDSAGLEDVTFHMTRHTFASWLIQSGMPIAEVQQYLGHASDTMTRRYAHLSPVNGRRNALEVLARGVGTNLAPEVDSERKAL